MRMAQVTPVYPPQRGGTGQVAFEYTERLRRRGHDVQVFTPSYGHTSGDPDYVHRVPPLFHVGNAAFAPALYRRLGGFDLVHLHYPFFGGSEPTVLRKALAGDHALITSYYMDAIASGVKGRFFQMHQAMVLPWVLSRSDRVLVSSIDYARHSALVATAGALDRVETHPFGIDLDRFHPGADPELRGSLGIPAGEPLLLFVGGLDPAHHFKGFPVLVAALQRLAGERWRLLVVGDGALRGSFEALVAAHGLADRVHFAGNVTDAALPACYRAADIHVFPSTGGGEAFGLVAAEAAASGIPTIASNLPGVRTVVLDGETGLLVPPGQHADLSASLRRLIADANLRATLGGQARAHAETAFCWEPLIDRLEETYASAVASHRARAT
jgi:glycosyltransferase involved in cell wall biosynthesis